uniref:PiggyBac transposable element-derived protein domain-containing protein n=1 Tax=Glossina austeni TaxID=7395 RepID=A0A1A9VH47_GLOAU
MCVRNRTTNVRLESMDGVFVVIGPEDIAGFVRHFYFIICIFIPQNVKRNINLSDKINNIDEDDEEVYDIDDDIAENYCDSLDSDTDEENILNIRRGQKGKRFIVSSESENEEEIETAMDGTVWKKIKEGSNSGKTSIYNIFKEVSRPTGYAKRNIMKAFSLIIDRKMIEHYARGAYEAKNINLSYLWNTKWGPSFFSTTMSRNDFAEIMKFIRFDNKNQRSQRLQNDKFALICEVWYKFIESSQN